jgi:peptidoglycan/LPS O-acetylase OafA/YrhL
LERVKELDGIRAIAILLVIGCHYQGFAGLLSGLPEFGWVGVDIFFVLSGYLITSILLGLKNKKTPYKTFYSRRAIRIFPPYIIITIVCIAMARLSHRSPRLLTPSFLLEQIFFLQAYTQSNWLFIKEFFFHLRWYAAHAPSFLQYAHNLPVGIVGLKPALGGPASTFWSLSIEEYFYLVWAPIVLRCRRSVVVSLVYLSAFLR